MHNRRFRIVPLPSEIAEEARRIAAQGRSDHAVITVESPHSAPCRHCLRWAEPGKRVILFPFASVPAGVPYSETGPIFVHQEACQPNAAATQYPLGFRQGRVLRAYDSSDNIIEAVVVNDETPESVIDRLLDDPQTDYLQVRSVSRGCFTFKIASA